MTTAPALANLHSRDDRLAEIEGMLEQGHWDEDWARDDIEWLITEVKRLRAVLKHGQALINDMDLRMPEQATEDEDGWIISYRIPVGPWHRILGWCRGAV